MFSLIRRSRLRRLLIEVGELRAMVRTDQLTGLLNRLVLEEAADRSRGPVGLLLLDLDGFKQINDVHGHRTGDALLFAVAERLTDLTGGPDGDGVTFAARLHGDEFAIWLGRTDRATATRRAAEVSAALAEPYTLPGGLRLRVTASVGAAVGAAPVDVETLLADADAAMYQAKRARRANRAVSLPSNPARPTARAHRDDQASADETAA
ncbi:GGDEF domain-containing protein [Actinoalloteichus sp. GBA129-24]|uniref:GGDEF domain-containing protein n=1 Tax=Actinoalloteichus sp. GBA129-24 TaxID=1612551 RepID=UPI000950A9BB|nr:GGDEF domain-containing protein [Actinoalloteichus sp. GBA129-24]APU20140.1 diguanylate cyclase (GGDEF) domain-containing protein [Actinoalloteichus sp. GBA129-24]